MIRALLVAGLLPLLAACDSKAAASPPTARELKTREFTQAMKAIDLEYEKIQADLADKKSPEDVRARVATIRATAEKASRLDYRDSEAENRELAFEFSKFLDAARKLEGAAWSGDDGSRAWRRLGNACASCHQIYRKDP